MCLKVQQYDTFAKVPYRYWSSITPTDTVCLDINHLAAIEQSGQKETAGTGRAERDRTGLHRQRTQRLQPALSPLQTPKRPPAAAGTVIAGGSHFLIEAKTPTFHPWKGGR